MTDPRFDQSTPEPTFARPVRRPTSSRPRRSHTALARRARPDRPQRAVTVAALVALLAGGLLGLTARTAAAAPSHASVTYRSHSVVPKGDGYVATKWPHAHFGRRSFLTVGTLHGNRRTAFFRFQVPQGGTVERAVLTVTRSGRWAPQWLSARLADSSEWNEWSLDRHTAPHIGRWIASTFAKAGTRAVHFDITSAFQYRRTATIALIAPNRRGVVQLASRQARRGRPQLHVVIGFGVRPPGSSSPAPTTTPTSTDPTSTDPTSTDPSSTASSDPSGTPTTPAPTTTDPTSTDPTSPTPTDPTSTGSGDCTVSAILVPSCGRWWGEAPDQFNWSVPAPQAAAHAEAVNDRPLDILHFYHVNTQPFPTPTEMALATQPSDNHLLLINWKPSTSLTWAQVAAGDADRSTIDPEADYLKSHWTEPFFLAIYHEPEDNVNPAPGSGMTASDYAAMYRHVVLRLRADGVHNAITVMDYMGWYKWEQQSWFNQLWPGDDVVDWIGLDPYAVGSDDLTHLVDRPNTGVPGYYDWATHNHPGTPIMLCEWGVSYDPSNPTGQVHFFHSVPEEISQYPDIKALVYYDVPNPTSGIPWTTVERNPQVEAAFRAAANDPAVVAPHWSY